MFISNNCIVSLVVKGKFGKTSKSLKNLINMIIGYNSMKFWDFPGLSKFPKILSLKSFSNSLCNSYIPYLLQIIALRFTCGERKFGKTSKCLKIL